jgi:hypothetical protein
MAYYDSHFQRFQSMVIVVAEPKRTTTAEAMWWSKAAHLTMDRKQ